MRQKMFLKLAPLLESLLLVKILLVLHLVTYPLRKSDDQPADDGFADNINIETEADAIIDFSEQNPFGIP